MPMRLAITGLMLLAMAASLPLRAQAQDRTWYWDCSDGWDCWVNINFYVPASGTFTFGTGYYWELHWLELHDSNGNTLPLSDAYVTLTGGERFHFQQCNEYGCTLPDEDTSYRFTEALFSASAITIEVNDGARWHTETFSLSSFNSTVQRMLDSEGLE